MLARLTMSTARRFLDVHIEPSRSTHQNEDGENSLVLDLHALRVLLPTIPDNAWHRVAGACGRAVAPICANLQQTLSNDFENVANLLLDLELRHGEASTLNDALPVGLLNEDIPRTVTSTINHSLKFAHPRERPPRKPWRSPQPTSSPIIIPSTHPSAPSIIITLSPPQPRETSCLIPYQDSAFGKCLTVPSHPVFNKNHPPMVLETYSLPRLDEWKWGNGHWEAVLLDLTEQARRGLFSKAITSRRKNRRLSRIETAAAVIAI